MAKVSLRIYNREIESMVDRGQLDEAIAHCRHILNTFPKNLETYRLLGKAYLEARRYNEATDIFERLLMAVPDDFVAHVGMSIIRDEQNDLDAAIWHMERAFEVQPSNTAIQSELQRLFGRRDGVEPPKIRLTRGALAHMYVQGELYPQAISEIKAVLEEDGERQDMQVLLARSYFHAGQKGDAAEMCGQLLRRYPYCLDANRVLVELLPETEQSESVQASRGRVNELDPYAPFVTGSVFHTGEVADAAVNLDRLDWDGEPVDLGQDWRDSLAIARGDETPAGEPEPDWLKTGLTAGSLSASPPSEESASVSSSDDEIPDFLREAGWGKDTGAYQEGPGSFEASDELSEEPALAEGDLPDWIKAMAPDDAEVAASSSQGAVGEDLTDDDVPDWLQGLGDVQDTTPEEQPLEQGDIPEWLAAIKSSEEESQESLSQVAEVGMEPAGQEDLPDWLKSVQPEAENLMAEGMPEEEQEETQQEILHETSPKGQEAPTESVSEWQLEEETADIVSFDATETGDLGISTDEQDDAIAWLEGLATKHGAKPEELVTDPDERKETEPDWVQQVKAVKDQEATLQDEHVTESSEDLPGFLAEKKLTDQTDESDAEVAMVDNLGTSADEQDDAIAWLESLATKHGAKPEELVTDPDARKEIAPDWVQKAVETGSSTQATTEEAAPLEEPNENIPDWISAGIDEKESLSPELEDTQPQKPLDRAGGEETGTSLTAQNEEGGVLGEQEPAAEIESPALEVDDDTPDWLRGLEAESPTAEASSPSNEEETEMPDWLRGVGTQPSEVEASQPTEEDGQEVPDWLRGDQEEPSEAESLPTASTEEESLEAEADQVSEVETPDIPDWLSGLEAKQTDSESLPPSPLEEESGLEPSQESVTKIDVNTASIEELAGLPGIGEFLARDIVAHRETYGAFSSIDDLSNIGGIGQSTIDDLRGRVDVHPSEPDITDWLQSVDEDETVSQVEDTVSEDTSGDIPSWLAGLEGEQAKSESVTGADDDLPEWLRAADEQEPVQTQSTASTDWQPAEVEASAQEETIEEPASDPDHFVQEQSDLAATPEPSELEAEPEPKLTVEPEREAAQEPVTETSSGMLGTLSATQEPSLAQAQLELTHGNVPGALDRYEKLIKKGKMLDEIIFDLREALYRYPVDVSILQALGDAYMRANRLQEALDSYTKAEELLR